MVGEGRGTSQVKRVLHYLSVTHGPEPLAYYFKKPSFIFTNLILHALLYTIGTRLNTML